MNLFLEPMDVWLFRDGRPFDAGSDHRAQSLFPPYPSVVQGALRSHHLVVNGVDLRDQAAIRRAVGTATDYGTLRLRGPFIANRQANAIVRYFPVPADVVPTGDGKVTSVKPRAAPDGVMTSTPTPMLLWSDREPKKDAAGEWLEDSELEKCLQGEPAATIRSSCLFARETRVGIGRDDMTHTTRDGALYEVEFIRPHKDVGLLIHVCGYNGWPSQGLMRIGGEGHAALFHAMDDVRWSLPPAELPQRFKLYFATPTFFTGGWIADWTQFFDGDVHLQAAAVRRYESIGGYDWAAQGHKPSRRYVPAGSVYYFTCHGAARLKPGLIQNAITDDGAEIGFGQVLIKEW